MVLCQIDAATHDATGQWLAIAIGILGAIWLGLQIFKSLFPNKDGMEAYVTQGQLRDELDGIKQSLERMENKLGGVVPKADLERELSKLETRFEKHESYVHQRHHDIMGQMQALLNSQAIVTAKMELVYSRLLDPPTKKV